MNRVPLLLLVLSLAANGVLAFLVLRPAGGAAPGAVPASTSAAKGAASAPGGGASGSLTAPLAERLAAARTPEDFKGALDALRAAGLPESLVRQVVRAAVSDEAMRRRQAIFDFTAAPYWRDPNPTPEQTKAMRAVEREVRALLADLGIPPSPLEQALRRRQFGGLPEAKAAALEKIQQDYQDLRQELYSAQRDRPMEDRMAQEKLLREEQQRDIDALLTPTEKLEWEVRTSSTAANLRRQIGSVEVTEQEFRALFAAQRTYEQVTQPSGLSMGPRTVEQQELTLAAWEAQQAEQRRVLGDERYRKLLLESVDRFGPRTAQFLRASPELGADQIAGVMRLSQSLSLDLQRATGGQNLPPAERQARTAAVQDRYRGELTQLLGAPKAQELIATGGLPGFGRPGGPASGAVRLPGGG